MKKPAYIRIKEALEKQIFSSPPGGIDFLSESRIIADFRVSATTARKTLNELQEEGLVERQVGKGTKVILFSEKEVKELGVIFFNIYNPGERFISDTVKGIEMEAQDKSCHLHLYTTRNKPITQDISSSIFHIISRRKIDGLFVLSNLPVSDIKFFREKRIPLVTVGIDYPNLDVPAVIFDYKRAIKDVGKKLLALGYRRIGIISGPKGKRGIQRSGDLVRLAYQEFCEHNKLYYNENFCKQRESSQEEGYQAMAEFSQLPENNRPQAIIAASTQAGKGALRYAQNNKEWQPFVVPFSDEKIDYPYYVFFPDKELGKSAFDLLEKHLKDYLAKPEKKLVPFSLISSG